MDDLTKKRLATLRAYNNWERENRPDKQHILDWAADEIERLHAVVVFLREVAKELERGRRLFPGDQLKGLALAEEFGELIKAMLDEPGEAVWKEAVQTAATAARVAIDGDGTVDEWRKGKGLDDHRNGAAGLRAENGAKAALMDEFGSRHGNVCASCGSHDFDEREIAGLPDEVPPRTGVYAVQYSIAESNCHPIALIPWCKCHGWAGHTVGIWTQNGKSSKRALEHMIGWWLVDLEAARAAIDAARLRAGKEESPRRAYAGVTVWVGDQSCTQQISREGLEDSRATELALAFDSACETLGRPTPRREGR